VSGLKPAAISELVGLAPNTVSQRIVRGTRRLRDQLRTHELFRTEAERAER